MGGAIFDETGAEYVVGTYIDSNGNKKPIYETCLFVNNINAQSYTFNFTHINKVILTTFGEARINTGNYISLGYAGCFNVVVGDTNLAVNSSNNYYFKDIYLKIQYTKTTDIAE